VVTRRLPLWMPGLVLLVLGLVGCGGAGQVVEPDGALPEGVRMFRLRMREGAAFSAWAVWSKRPHRIDSLNYVAPVLLIRCDRADRLGVDFVRGHEGKRRLVLADGELSLQRRGHGARSIPDEHPRLEGLLRSLRSEDTTWALYQPDDDEPSWVHPVHTLVSLGQPDGWPIPTELLLAFAPSADTPAYLIAAQPEGSYEKLELRTFGLDPVFEDDAHLDRRASQELPEPPWPKQLLY
jgi:hypothetical protein